MGLPAVLKNFNQFSDGDSYLGQVAEIELPKLTLATEEWRGGGMLAAIDVNMGLEKLEMTSKYGGLVVGVLRRFGQLGVDGTMQRFVGAYQQDDTGGVVAAELVTRGLHTEIDPGTAKVKDKTEWSVKSTLSYLKWTIQGRVEVEIDVLDNVFIVGGVDRLAAIRAALQQ
jgi:hypothetical protein